MIYTENISTEEIELMETLSFDGPISVITEKNEEFAEAMDYLNNQWIIGFDTETKPSFQANAPHNSVALLQLSGQDRAFLFRLNTLKLPSTLIAILSNADIIKVGAAVHDDIRGLQKYAKFIPKGFIDLQKIAESYGIYEKSVKKMAGIIIGKKVSKSQQLSNWEAPQLSGAQIKYAAIDAWVCREMYLKLKANG